MTVVTHARLPLNATLGPSSSPAFTSFLLDATADKVGWVFQAKDGNAITHVGFRYGSRTGTPPTYKIGLQSVNTSGMPDGAYLGGGSPASATFTPPADTSWDGTVRWIALDNSYTPAAGDALALVIEYSSGTVDGSNNSSISNRTASPYGYPVGNPYTLTNTGTWSQLSGQCFFGIRTASTRYGLLASSWYRTRSASTVGNRVAAKVNLPATLLTSYQVRGARLRASPALAVGKTPVFGLWSASSTLQSITLDSDAMFDPSGDPYDREFVFSGALSTLTAGTDYYLGFQIADAASGGVILGGWQLDSADDQVMHPFGSGACCFSSYNGSAWSDNNTIRPFVELLLEDITIPAASGGFVAAPGFGYTGIGVH